MLSRVLVALLFAAMPRLGPHDSDCPPPIEAVLAHYRLPLVTASGGAHEWTGVLLLDATEDGTPEVFVADRPERGGNAGEPWRVYRLAGTRSYEAIGEVFFHRRGFMVEGRMLRMYWRLSAGSGSFHSYRILDQSIEKVASTSVLSERQPEYDRRRKEIATWRDAHDGFAFAAKRRDAEGSEGSTLVCRQLD